MICAAQSGRQFLRHGHPDCIVVGALDLRCIAASSNPSIEEIRKKLRLLVTCHVNRSPQKSVPGEHASRLLLQEAHMDTNLVSRDPEIMSGTLCFTGTRVPVQNLFDYFEGTSSLEDFLEDFPSIQREKAVAVLEAARERLFADAPAA